MIKNITYTFLFFSLSMMADVEFKDDISLRVGVQTQDSKSDLALGGVVHIESKEVDGVSGGVTFATSNVLFGKNDSDGIKFFDTNSNSYSILQEAYLRYEYLNTTLKIGRQIIDSPFADSDDVGMVANSFEAYVLTYSDFNALFTLAYLTSMSGEDAPTIEKFSNINANSGVLALGLNYDLSSDLSLNSCFYNIPSTAKYTYVDMVYNKSLKDLEYGVTFQYALQDYESREDAKVYGLGLNLSYSGITLAFAYNKSADGVADNGFGGGPFLTSMEHLTLVEAGIDGEVYSYGLEFEVFDFLHIYLSNANLKSQDSKDADEFDAVLSCSMNEKLSFDLIYSNVDDDINKDNFTNSRFFVNYQF